MFYYKDKDKKFSCKEIVLSSLLVNSYLMVLYT